MGQNNYYQFYDTKLYYLNSTSYPKLANEIDLLYISTTEKLDIPQLLSIIQPSQIIISSNCIWQTKEFFKENILENVKVHFLKE
jgi:hypothetical protein